MAWERPSGLLRDLLGPSAWRRGTGVGDARGRCEVAEQKGSGRDNGG